VLSTPAVDANRVFFGSYDGDVYAVDAARGTLLWKHPTGAPVVSTPTVFRGKVIVGSRSYDLLGLDEQTGEPAWTRYFWFSWIESPVAVRDGVGYVGSSDALLLTAFDPLTGKGLWSLDVHGWAWGEPVVTSKRVYIGTGALGEDKERCEPGALAVDRKSGNVVWHWVPEGPKGPAAAGFASSGAAGDGRVFFGAVDGRVYAFAE
jgi:outer membrane protein assembly factor BamB